MKRSLVMLACVLVAACGGAPAATTSVTADLTEFSVTLGTQQGAAGPVTFAVRNTGSIVHAFVVVRTDLAAGSLPVEAGVVAEEGLDVVGEVEDIAAGSSTQLTADLPAGHYVVLCNIEGHYPAGMYADLTMR